jgi:Integrase core domain
MGPVVLRTPVRAPQANAFCERVIGAIRRECLDFVIPMNERHLRAVLRDWCAHYNRGRPHASLGPGIPEGPDEDRISQSTGHQLPDGYAGGSHLLTQGELNTPRSLQPFNGLSLVLDPQFVADIVRERLPPYATVRALADGGFVVLVTA